MEHEPYQYVPLDTTEHHIRLVRLSSYLEGDGATVQLDIASFPMETVAGKYHALSYTWGPVTPTYRIWVNGRYMELRQNITHFLRFVSRPGSSLKAGLFWIDSICINQNDVKEKNHQVARMGEVYRNANQVLIWLGETSESAAIQQNASGELVLRELASISPYAEGSKVWRDRQPFWLTSRISVQELRPVAEYLVQALHHEYWNRLWIIQEICLSRSALVISRSRLIYWENLISVHAWLSELIKFRPDLDVTEFCNNLDLESTYERIAILATFTEARRICTDTPLKEPRDGRRFRNLAHLIAMFGKHECENPRDRVYGLLALSRETRVTIDYEQSPESLLLRMLELQDRLLHVSRLSSVLTHLMRSLKVSSASLKCLVNTASSGSCHVSYRASIATLCYLEQCEELIDQVANQHVTYQLRQDSLDSKSFFRESYRDDFDTEGYVLAVLSCLDPLGEEPRRHPFLLLHVTKENTMKVLHLVMKINVDEHRRILQTRPMTKRMRCNIESQINLYHKDGEFMLQTPQGNAPYSLPLPLPVLDAMYIIEQ